MNAPADCPRQPRTRLPAQRWPPARSGADVWARGPAVPGERVDEIWPLARFSDRWLWKRCPEPRLATLEIPVSRTDTPRWRATMGASRASHAHGTEAPNLPIELRAHARRRRRRSGDLL